MSKQQPGATPATARLPFLPLSLAPSLGHHSPFYPHRLTPACRPFCTNDRRRYARHVHPLVVEQQQRRAEASAQAAQQREEERAKREAAREAREAERVHKLQGKQVAKKAEAASLAVRAPAPAHPKKRPRADAGRATVATPCRRRRERSDAAVQPLLPAPPPPPPRRLRLSSAWLPYALAWRSCG